MCRTDNKRLRIFHGMRFGNSDQAENAFNTPPSGCKVIIRIIKIIIYDQIQNEVKIRSRATL